MDKYVSSNSYRKSYYTTEKKAPDISVTTEQDLTSPKSQNRSLMISATIEQDVKSCKTNVSGISDEVVHHFTSPMQPAKIEQLEACLKSKKQSPIITAEIEQDATSQKFEKQMVQKGIKKNKQAVISYDPPLSTLVKINKQNEKKEAAKNIQSPKTRSQQKMLREQSNETSPITDLNQINKLTSKRKVKPPKSQKRRLNMCADIEQPVTLPKSINILPNISATNEEHIQSPKSKKESDIFTGVAQVLTSSKLKKKIPNIIAANEQDATSPESEKQMDHISIKKNKQTTISDNIPLSTLVQINDQNEKKEGAKYIQSPRTRNQQKKLIEQSFKISPTTDLNQNDKIASATIEQDIKPPKPKKRPLNIAADIEQPVTSPKSKKKLPTISATTEQYVKSPKSKKKVSDISRVLQDVTSPKPKKKAYDVSSSTELDVTSPKSKDNLPSIPVTFQQNVKSPKSEKKSPVISSAIGNNKEQPKVKKKASDISATVEQDVTSPKSKKKTPDICAATEQIVTLTKHKKRQPVNNKELATVFDNQPISTLSKINAGAATKTPAKDVGPNTRNQQKDLSEKSNDTSYTDINQIKTAPPRKKRDRWKKLPDIPTLTTVVPEGNDGVNKIKILHVQNIKGPCLNEEKPDKESMPVYDYVDVKDQITGTSGASVHKNKKNQLASQIKIVPSTVKRKAQETTIKRPSKKKKQNSGTTEPLTEEEEIMLKDNIQLQNTPVVKGKNKQLQRNQARARKELINKAKDTSLNKQMHAHEKSKRPKTDTDLNSLTLKEEIPYIAEGLKEDCEKLIEKCLQVYKLNFEKFSEIWKQMNFACIYYDRQSSAELAELSEEAIHVAKSHMVAKNTNFEKNVAGLFLVYAFLNHQPYAQFASLRLVPQDVPAIKHLEAEARKQRRHDVIYVLGSVLIRGPCQFHVLEREVGLEFPIRKYWDGSIQNLCPVSVGLLTKSSELVGQFKNCQAIDQKLKSMHKKLLERNIDVKTFTSRQPAEALLNSYWRYVPGSTRSEEINETLNKMKSPSPEVDRHEVMRSLKARAMGNIVDPMRHLSGVNERLDKSLTPPTLSPNNSTDESEDTARRYKGKGKGKGGRYSAKSFHGLLEKADDVATKQCFAELNAQIVTQCDKVNALPDLSLSVISDADNEHGKMDSNTSIDEDVNFIRPTVVDSANVTNTNGKNVKCRRKTKQQPMSDTDEIVNKPIIEPYNNPVKAQFDVTNESEKLLEVVKNITDNNNTKVDEITEASKDTKDSSSLCEELEIRLNSIPIEIHNVNDNIEIEIIDNFDYKKANENKNTEGSKNDKNTMQKENEETQSEPISAGNNYSSNVITAEQLEAKKKQREKRGFKRMRIKSKFKKLGMLDVANFDVSEGDES